MMLRSDQRNVGSKGEGTDMKKEFRDGIVSANVTVPHSA